MTIQDYLDKLNNSPETLEFQQLMDVIDQNYHFTPTAFRNGDVHNAPGENSGSCKLLAFAQLHSLSEQQTLACFGQYYRSDVLGDPEGDSHQNIRNFMRSGWSGVEFETVPLVLRD